MKNSIAVDFKYNTRAWISAMLLIIISYPMWLWEMPPNIIAWASIALLVVVFDDILENRKYYKLGLLAFIIQIVFVGRYYILPDTNLNGYIMVFLRGLGYASIFLCSTEFWKKIVDHFIKLLAILLVPALIEHIFISFTHVSTVAPHYIEECPINPDREYNSYLFNAYLTNTFDVASQFRLMAFFDEPGVLGNIVMVLLYLQKFDLKKWYNIVFLIAGVLSFSLAFYIAVAAYYIIFGNVKVKVSFIVVIILLVWFFYENEYVYDLVFRRFVFEDGGMTGYNREMHSDIGSWIKRVSIIDYLFWGYQPRSAIPYAASWRWAFVLYGIIPSIIYLGAIIIPRLKMIYKKRDVLLGLILVVIIWIQRPFLQLYLYSFLLAIPFIYFSTPKKKINH